MKHYYEIGENEIGVARMGEKRMHTKFQCENEKARDHLEDLCSIGRIIYTWVNIKR
jgi:hypothetical protein